MKIEVIDEDEEDEHDQTDDHDVDSARESSNAVVPQDLQDRAEHLIASIQSINPTDEQDHKELSDNLEALLTTVIKVLFTATQHQDLTSTGRINRLPAAPLSSIGLSSGTDSVFDPPPPWRNQWTTDLLSFIIARLSEIEPLKDRKIILESHFHLLVPPILNLIDDAKLPYKAKGCNLLDEFCLALIATQSDLMNRTGLAEVFIDAMKRNFIFLPTLTDEDESLTLLKAMYPAFFSVVNARFITLTLYMSSTSSSSSSSKATETETDADELANANTKSTSSSGAATTTMMMMNASQIQTETTLRTNHLTSLLRDSLLKSLSHLSTNGSTAPGSSSTSPAITTYLLSQIKPLTEHLKIHTTAHLQLLLPLLHATLADPFVTSFPPMVLASVEALETVVRHCWPRVRETWWRTCLAAVVAGWFNVVDEIAAAPATTADRRRSQNKNDDDDDDDRSQTFHQIQRTLQNLAELLLEIVGPDMQIARRRLLEEEEDQDGDLKTLFINT